MLNIDKQVSIIKAVSSSGAGDGFGIIQSLYTNNQ